MTLGEKVSWTSREERVIEPLVEIGFRGLLLLPLKPNFDNVHEL